MLKKRMRTSVRLFIDVFIQSSLLTMSIIFYMVFGFHKLWICFLLLGMLGWQFLYAAYMTATKEDWYSKKFMKTLRLFLSISLIPFFVVLVGYIFTIDAMIYNTLFWAWLFLAALIALIRYFISIKTVIDRLRLPKTFWDL